MTPGSSWRSATPGTGSAFVPVQARRALSKANNTTSPASASRPKSASKSTASGATTTATTTATAAPSKPSANAAPTAAAAKKIEWPPAVRQYVQRSFVTQNNIDGIGRTEMEVKLKQIITSAADNGTLHVVDWSTMPLPQEMLRDERAQAHTHTQSQVQVQVQGQRQAQIPHRQRDAIHFQMDDTKKKKRGKEAAAGAEEAEAEDGPMHKTKSDFMDPATSPWKKANIRSSNDDAKRRRVAEGAGEDKKSKSGLVGNNEKVKKATLEVRRRRFESTVSPYAPSSDGISEDNFNRTAPASAHKKGPIVGRCQNLEKNYFRLTSAPNPDVVRPVPVLKKTLDLLKKKWRTENNYGYVCDQFKSLRQDLTVQHVRSEFTTAVYEIHARIALEKGDLGEYNQCQTQLRALYKAGLGGHPREFLAYRILYFIYTRNWTAITDTLAELEAADVEDPAVKHALEVRKMLARGNYHRFFHLYLNTPNMGAYLMDMFVERERLSALATICRAYKPDVRIRFITEELGFESDEQSARFILEHSGGHLLQQVEDEVRFVSGKAGFVFEQARAEAHRVVDIKGQI